MAKYVCLGHEPPLVFKGRYSLMQHLRRHGIVFKDHSFSLQEARCTCDRGFESSGFRSILGLLAHLSKEHDIHVIYSRSVSNRVMYADGVGKTLAKQELQEKDYREVVLEGLSSDEERQVLRDAEELSKKFCQSVFAGNTRSVYAGALYVCTTKTRELKRFTQREIACLLDLTEVTVRNNYQRIWRWLECNPEVMEAFKEALNLD